MVCFRQLFELLKELCHFRRIQGRAHQLHKCIHRDQSNIEIDGQNAADEAQHFVGRCLLAYRIFAGVHETNLMAQVIHIALIIIDKNNIAVFILQ